MEKKHSPPPKRAKKEDTKETKGTSSSPSSNLPTKLHYTTIYSKDAKKTAEFYRDCFNFDITYEHEGNAWFELKPKNRDKKYDKGFPSSASSYTTIGIHAIQEGMKVPNGTLRIKFCCSRFGEVSRARYQNGRR